MGARPTEPCKKVKSARLAISKPRPFPNFRHNPPAVQTDWESVPIQGTAEGATPVTAQAHEPIGTGKSGES